jgi:hypothetical protein
MSKLLTILKAMVRTGKYWDDSFHWFDSKDSFPNLPLGRPRSLRRNERPLPPRGILTRMAALQKLDRQQWVARVRQ